MQAKGFKSHTEWVTALAWHPTSPNHLLSASHDKTLKLWDTRASLPLATVQGHTDKVHPLHLHFAICNSLCLNLGEGPGYVFLRCVSRRGGEESSRRLKLARWEGYMLSAGVQGLLTYV